MVLLHAQWPWSSTLRHLRLPQCIGGSDRANGSALSVHLPPSRLDDWARMDENDIECPASALAPLCKLRYLRTLTLEKNKLTEIPALIGTMLSLRKISLHTNSIIELPAAMCLLTSLENLDLHKNAIRVLPSAIGNLRSLQKLDLSENQLSELPQTICELNENLQLVGRNPLEKHQLSKRVRAWRHPAFLWFLKEERG